jgi:chromatin segregation and condensation protein Rec8/ScpA/Scc1 (kleisin family)
MKEVYNELKQLGNNVTFQNFLPEWTRENIVKYIFPVLHLADDNKISLEQKEWFGDIRLSII